MKRLVADLLLRSGALRRAALRSGRQRIVLAFHNVVPDAESGVGDASLHMKQSGFAEFVATLQRIGGCVPLAQLLADARRGRPAQGLEFALTFDDAYAGAVSHGVDAALSLGAPVTIFVAPAMLGMAATWWDLAATEGVIGAVQRDAWLDGASAGRAEFITPELARSRPLPRCYGIATESSLRQVAERPLVTLASHSWSHASLSALSEHDPARLQRELEEPLRWLRAHVPKVVAPWLAYPYGRVNAEAMKAAASAGYEAAFRVDGGALREDQPAMALPRINVPAGMRAAAAMLRAAGWR